MSLRLLYRRWPEIWRASNVLICKWLTTDGRLLPDLHMHQQRYANSRRVCMVKNVKRVAMARSPGPRQTGAFVQTHLRVVANFSIDDLSQLPPQLNPASSWLDVSDRYLATCAR